MGKAKKFVELTHKNFLAKVVQTLGEEGSAKFSATYKHPQNAQNYLMYVFPKREATLMAMSYSPAISAAVYDRMTATLWYSGVKCGVVHTMKIKSLTKFRVY